MDDRNNTIDRNDKNDKNPRESAVPIRLAQQPEADALLGRSPLAALVGMLLDQQVPMEWAFSFRVHSGRVA